MHCKDIMSKDIQIVSADQTLQQAAQLMRDYDIGMLPVYNGDTIVGTITDRDIVVLAVARGLNTGKAVVAEAMTKNVFSCFEDDSIEEAARIMRERQIRRIIVTDRRKHPTGVISIGDLAAKGDRPTVTETTLERVSSPGH